MINQDLIEYGKNGSIIREMNKFATKRATEIGAENVFNFTIGNPSVPPPPCVQECIDYLVHTIPATELHAYTPAAGLPAVRKKIAAWLSENYDVPYRANDIYMTNGASSALAILCKALLCNGDQVIVLAPYFPEYRIYVEAAGASLIVVPPQNNNLQIDLEQFKHALSPKTAVVILNSPNNPSGYIIPREILNKIAQILEQKQHEFAHPIYIIADEPYRELSYGVDVPFIPTIYTNSIFCYSLSKSLSLPGDRIGFLALSPKIVPYDKIYAAICGAARIFGYICLSPLLQMMTAECLGKTADFTIYRENRDLIYTALKKIGFHCVYPQGAFYLFMQTPVDTIEFCKKAMDFNILLVPSNEFGCEGYARLAYCVPKKQIECSLPMFRQLAKYYGIE